MARDATKISASQSAGYAPFTKLPMAQWSHPMMHDPMHMPHGLAVPSIGSLPSLVHEDYGLRWCP
ncbi:hypothetical protein GSI_09679 [Ganoderma sinense ZZ0214-1]|uniref:Uncharacterized protein n=1 Tax=Ganoderma sinense ZZ0214-1 TaxID=1077348 RepID=A0A2G8S3F8_9APHY|nr:hypothetical protein GSI_09679 [Ganoderma sinense ZZ0214-1]